MFSYAQNDVKNCLKTGKIRLFCGIQVYTKQGASLVSESNALPNLFCGKFGELLLGKLSLNVDNNAGAYYAD